MSSEYVPPRPDWPHPTSPPPAVRPTTGRIADRPKATWRTWEAIGVYVLAFLLGGFASLPILELIDDDGLAGLAAAAVASTIIFVVLFIWLSRAHPTWPQVMGFPGPGEWWREIGRAIGFGLLLYPAMVLVVGIAVSIVLSALSGEPVRAPEQLPGDLHLGGVVVAWLYAVVIAPLHEELFFRGVLFRALRDRRGLAAGLVATGVAFSLVHYLPGPWQDTVLLIAVMFFNGMALAWFYERRGTLVAPIVAHMVFNVIGLSLLLTFGAIGGG
jgi:membrane protease YdiL (CAAX protease family)